MRKSDILKWLWVTIYGISCILSYKNPVAILMLIATNISMLFYVKSQYKNV